jgi:predicted NAD/FAD-dependent oxidoreductase
VADYDVIVIGGGAAGLSAAGLLAKEGKKVLLLEKSNYFGGRASQVDDEGFRVSLGGHLMEDPGSGIMRIAKEIGHSIEVGPISTNMAVWDHETMKWGSIRDRYSGANRTDLKNGMIALCVIGSISTPKIQAFTTFLNSPLCSNV